MYAQADKPRRITGADKQQQSSFTITLFRGCRAEKAKLRDAVSGVRAAKRAVNFEFSEDIEFSTPPSTPPVAAQPFNTTPLDSGCSLQKSSSNDLSKSMDKDFAVVHMKESAAAMASHYDSSTEAENLQGIGRGSGGGNSGGGSKRRCRNAKGGILSSSQTTLSTTATSVMKQALHRRMRSASPLQSMGAGVRGREECASMYSGNNPPITRRVASMSPPNSALKIDRDRDTKRTQAPRDIMRAGEQANRLPSWWSKGVALSTRMLGSGHISGGNRGKGNKTTSATDIVTQREKGDDGKEGDKEGKWGEVKQAARSVDHEQNRIVQVPRNSRFESLSEDEIISQAIQNLRRIRESGVEAAVEVRIAGGQ